MTTKPGLQKIVKTILNIEDENKHNHEHRGINISHQMKDTLFYFL
jgi:hypothetical protein